MLEPDLILLDEPTNHLDVEGILWLEALLKSEPHAFLVISHDRRFLESVATRVWELNRSYPDGMFQVTGRYSDFLEQRDSQRCALACAAGYAKILDVIEQSGYDTVTRRVSASRLTLFGVAWRSWWGVLPRLGGEAPSRPPLARQASPR